METDSQNHGLAFMIRHLIYNAGLQEDVSGHSVHWLAKIATICFLGNIVRQVLGLFTENGDPKKLFECFSVLTFCAMGVLKLCSLHFDYERWSFLLCQVETLENEQSNTIDEQTEYDTDDEESDSYFSLKIRRYTEKFQSISTLLSKIYRSTLIIFIVSPFIEYGYWKFRGDEPVYPHILPGWTALDNVSFYAYLLSIVFETIAAIYCVTVHIAFDLTVEGIMIFICGQFSLLRDCSMDIAGRGRDITLSKKRDDRAHFRIAKCHRTHLLLVNSIIELDKLVKTIFGVYFLVATLTLCSVAVRFKSEELSVMQLVSLLQYMCATLTQLFLFCHYGDAVLHESSMGVGEGAFGAACWSVSPRVRRELALLVVGMARRRQLRAGPFNSLNLPSFIQILRTAYSYYAVLRK